MYDPRKHLRVRYPILKLRKGTTLHDCIGYEFDSPSHYNACLEPPNYPMPALRDVAQWDLWLLYRPYPARYQIRARHLD